MPSLEIAVDATIAICFKSVPFLLIFFFFFCQIPGVGCVSKILPSLVLELQTFYMTTFRSFKHLDFTFFFLFFFLFFKSSSACFRERYLLGAKKKEENSVDKWLRWKEVIFTSLYKRKIIQITRIDQVELLFIVAPHLFVVIVVGVTVGEEASKWFHS